MSAIEQFKAARDEYKRHRAVLYEAVGAVLAQHAEPLPASRYQALIYPALDLTADTDSYRSVTSDVPLKSM